MSAAPPSTRAAPPSTRVVVVIGMHRSGTSLCSSMLQGLGADMADGPDPAPGNINGHWERARVVETNDAILALFGRSWLSRTHGLDLPSGWEADPRLRPHRERAMAWLGPKLAAGARFGFKDPRTTLLLGFWQAVLAEAGGEPRYVFCVRDPAQVARSLHVRDAMERGQAEYRWLAYNVEAVRGVGAAPVCIVPYEAWFDQPMELASRLARHVGLPEPAEATVREVMDAELRHDDAAVEPPGRLAARLHGMILRDAGKPRFTPRLRDFAGLVGEFRAQVLPLLTDMEVMRVGLGEQRRVIGDLQSLVKRLREAERA